MWACWHGSRQAAARRAGTGRRPHAPRERLRLHRAQGPARRPEGAALTKYGNSNHEHRCAVSVGGSNRIRRLVETSAEARQPRTPRLWATGSTALVQ